MTKGYHPSPAELQLFASLRFEVSAHPSLFVEAASWFAREFSLAAIDARAEADLTPTERELRAQQEKAGRVFYKREDRSGYMERLLRATESLIEIDDSALAEVDRLEHYRRVVLVGALMTDPDFQTGAPLLAAAIGMDRAHWPTREALVEHDDDVELDRWWARDIVFDPRFQVYRPFEELVRRALATLEARPRSTEARPPEPAPFDAAALNDPDRAVLIALEAARREQPPRALDGGEIRAEAKKRGLYVFRDARHARQTIDSLRKRGWAIPNAGNRTGFRLPIPLAQTCPDLLKLL